jgi:hypothetical protein
MIILSLGVSHLQQQSPTFPASGSQSLFEV